MNLALVFLGVMFLSILFWSFYSRLSTPYGAPYVPMEPEVVKRIITLAKIKEDEVFFDLGSGDGRVVIAAAYAGAYAYGVEIDPIRAWYSRFMIALFGLSKKASIIQKDFFQVDLKDADIITMFLLQETNENLLSKLTNELKSGTRVISYAFTLPGWDKELIDINSNSIFGPLYVYKKAYSKN